MKLFYRELGQGQPIIMLHGIFGSSDNWLTQSRMLSDQFRTFSLDLRNHGQSPHDDAFDYPSMVSDVVAFIEEHDLVDPVIIGHSMGGKVAMNLAVSHPDKLQKLIVVDMAPKPYSMENYVVLQGLNSVPITEVKTREQADQALAIHVGEPDVRMFLLKNLQRNPEGGFRWKLNLPAITANISRIGEAVEGKGTFEKPSLFIRGSKSDYIKDHDFDRIRAVFPAAEFETFDTGHWVPAEKPKEFVDSVRRFIKT